MSHEPVADNANTSNSQPLSDNVIISNHSHNTAATAAAAAAAAAATLNNANMSIRNPHENCPDHYYQRKREAQVTSEYLNDGEDYLRYANEQKHDGSANAYADGDGVSTPSSADINKSKTHDENGVTVEVNYDEGDVHIPKHYNFAERVVNLIIPRGGFLSGVFNLASVTLGAGILSIPSAFNTSGMIMAIIYLLVVTTLTVYSIKLLVIASEKTGLRSFEALSRGLFGRGGDIFTAVLMWLLCFGGAMGYVIAVGDVIASFCKHDGVPSFLQKLSGQRILLSVIWLLFMFPLTLPKQVNSLRYASAFGVCFIILFVICVVIHSCMYAFKGGIRKDLIMVQPGNNAVSGLSLFIFAYLCQVNVFKIHYETPDRSVNKITSQAAASCAMCGSLYFLTGFFGYAEFGPGLNGNVLQYYDPYHQVQFFICYIGLIIKLCAAFSLNMLACRTALFQCMRWEVDTMPYWKHTIFSSTFAIGALLLGIFVADINIVFGLAGSLCGGFIAFAFPALFVMYSGNWSLKTVGIWNYLATYLLLFCGVVGIIFGTGSSILSAVIKYTS